MADDSKTVYNVEAVKDCKCVVVGDAPKITIINKYLFNTKDQENVSEDQNGSIRAPTEFLDGGYSAAGSIIEKITSVTGTSIIALVDFNPNLTDSLAFNKGDVGRLIKKEETGMWFIELKGLKGWVPMKYWEEVKEDQSGSLLQENKWFGGKMSREQCEDLFGQRGKNGNFIIRESVKRVGCYAISIMYIFKVYHFPIQKSSSGKLYIDKKGFDNLLEIVTHYSTNPLFYTDKEEPITIDIDKPLLCE